MLEGFGEMPEVEVHVISCLQERPVSSPARLADNIFYHGLIVPKLGWLRTGYSGCVRAVRRKLKALAGLPPAVARRRLAGYLERRGVSPEIIIAMCRRPIDATTDAEEGAHRGKSVGSSPGSASNVDLRTAE